MYMYGRYLENKWKKKRSAHLMIHLAESEEQWRTLCAVCRKTNYTNVKNGEIT